MGLAQATDAIPPHTMESTRTSMRSRSTSPTIMTGTIIPTPTLFFGPLTFAMAMQRVVGAHLVVIHVQFQSYI